MASAPGIHAPRTGRSRWLALLDGSLPWVAVFGLAIVAGVAARFLILDRLIYEIWSDRDLSRAAELFRQPLFTGAEFDRGGRTPGGFYYLLLRTYMVLGPTPAHVQVGTVVLDVAALAALGAVMRRHLGWPAGLAAAAFHACSPAVFGHLWIAAYNPTNAFPFGTLAHAALLEAVLGRRRAALPVAFLLVALAAQIHFSYLLLLPLFALVMAVQRVGLGGRAWAAALLAFVVAYVPYLVADGLAGWPNAREIAARQDIVAAPAALALLGGKAGSAQPRLDGLSTVLLAFPLPTARPWLHYGAVRLYGIGLWRLFPVVLVAAYLVHLAWTRKRPAAAPGVAAGRRAALAALTIIAGGLLLLSARNTSLVIRYVMFLLPCGAILFGCAFQAYADARARAERTWRRTILDLTLLGAAALWTLATPLGYALIPPPRLPVEAWRGLIRTLQRDLGFSRRDVLERVVLVDATVDPPALMSPTRTAGAYLARVFGESRGESRGETRGGDPARRCALVLVSSPQGAAPGADRVRDAFRLLPPPVPAEAHTISGPAGLTVVAYRPEAGSCPHNLDDRYVPTPEEDALAAALAGRPATSGRDVVAEIESAGGRRFVVSVASRNPAFRPLRAMVEILVQGGALSADLHSNELRGYDGLSSYRARGTSLVLEDGRGEWRVPIHSGTLGGWFNPALTPWRSPSVAIPPGRYRVDLAIDDVAFLESGGSEGPRRLRLADALEVPPSAPVRE